MLAVDCGSVVVTAWRAWMAAICAGVACLATAGVSPQKPRALMMSAGVCGLAELELLSAGAAGYGAVAWAICMSAEANWISEPARGFARGTGTGSAALAGVASAT